MFFGKVLGISFSHEVHYILEGNAVCPDLEESCLYHNPTEGAGDGDGGCPFPEEFLGSSEGGSLVGLFFHPHPPSPSPTAEGFLSGVGWFHEAIAREVHRVVQENPDGGIQLVLVRGDSEGKPWSVHFLIHSGEVARVVEGNRAFLEAGRGEASLLDPFGEELGMVDHLIAHSKFGIFVFESVIAVGAKGDDFLELIFSEGLGILGDVLLEKEIISDSSCGVPGASFFVSEASEGSADFFHQSCQGSEGLACFGVQGCSASCPEKVFKGIALGGKSPGNGDIGFLHPVFTVCGGLSPGASCGLEKAEGGVGCLGQFAFCDEISARPDDEVHVADKDGADVHAGVAGGACPESFWADCIRNRSFFSVLAGAFCKGEDVLDHFSGVKGFSYGVCGTYFGTATTFHARIQG